MAVRARPIRSALASTRPSNTGIKRLNPLIRKMSIAASGVRHSGALTFEHRRNLLWEVMTRHGYELPVDARVV